MKRQWLLLVIVAAFGLTTTACTSESTEKEAPADIGSASPPVSGHRRISSVIQLTSAQAGDLTIPQGTMAVYDAAQGDLVIGGKLIIHGTLRLVSSKESVKDVAIQVSDITNDGDIQSELSGTILLQDASGKDLTINSSNGKIRTSGTIDVAAAGNISMQGGHFHAETVRFSTPAKVNVDAQSIDGNVSIDAKKSKVGVVDGDLKVIHQGGGEDPIYYSTNASVTVPDLSAGVNGDVVAWAKKNVTTSGIKASGTIKLYAGVSSYTWNVSPIPQSGQGCGATPCSQAITFNYQTNAGTITVNGNLQSTQAGSIVAKTGWLTGNNPININGTITTAGGFVYLYAGCSVATGSINTSGPGSSGAVVIQANRSCSQTVNPFVVGGSGNSNGVNGTITAVNAGAQTLYSGFVYISNPGPTHSQGGITVAHASDINLSIGGSDNGSLILDNFYNPINLPSGTFSVDGQNGHPAGRLYIQADNLTTGATTLTASEAGEPGSGQPHYVQVSVNSITANGNLVLKADGNSDFATSGAPNVGLWPWDSLFFDVVYNQLQGRLDIYPTLDTCFHQPIAVNGSGTFTMQGRGSGTVLQTCNSYYSPGENLGPMTFNGGAATWDVNGRNGSDAGSILIDTDQVVLGPSTTLSLNANGDGSGKGGTIALNAIGSDATNVSNRASFSANGGPTGNGGTIAMTFPGLVFTGSLNANGGTTSGNGGNISFTDTGTTTPVSIGGTGFSINAAAPTSGNGGSVTLVSGADAINVNATGVSVAASGGGTGGLIDVESDNQLTVTGVLSADGKGSGFPGTITLHQTIGSTQPMVLDGATISASGDPAGDGSGHDITITNSGTMGISMAGTILKADASPNGNAFGGSIHISTPNGSGTAVDLTQPNTSISAKGATNGAGGTVIITNVAAFNVNSVIQVSAGSGVTNTSTFDGSISLNNVPCRQWLTGYSWPKSYWNCVNPSSPTTQDQLPALVASNLPNDIPTTISNAQDSVLYVMVDASQWSTYFATFLAAGTAGFTFADNVDDPPLYTAIFKNVTLARSGYTSLPDGWLTEVTTHEMGHQLDAANGIESANAMFNPIVADFEFLDTLGGGNPCTIGSGTAQGPFVEVVDSLTGLQFCSGGVLNSNPGGIYTGKTNHEIAQLSSQNLLFDTKFLSQAHTNTEPYSQAFAYQGYAKDSLFPPGYFDPTADGLFQKGYFYCAQSHAASLLGITFTPTYTYTCN